MNNNNNSKNTSVPRIHRHNKVRVSFNVVHIQPHTHNPHIEQCPSPLVVPSVFFVVSRTNSPSGEVNNKWSRTIDVKPPCDFGQIVDVVVRYRLVLKSYICLLIRGLSNYFSTAYMRCQISLVLLCLQSIYHPRYHGLRRTYNEDL